MPGSHFSWCSCVPSCSTAEPNRPHCTPDLICRLGSAATSSTKPAMFAPLFASPPNSFGNARCTPPCSTSRCIWLSTRSRCSSMLRPSTRQNAGSLIISRASRRVSAHVPSSMSVTLSTSMRASDASAAVCGAVGAPPAGVRLLVAGFLERTAASAMASPFGGRRSRFDGRTPTRHRKFRWTMYTTPPGGVAGAGCALPTACRRAGRRMASTEGCARGFSAVRQRGPVAARSHRPRARS